MSNPELRPTAEILAELKALSEAAITKSSEEDVSFEDVALIAVEFCDWMPRLIAWAEYCESEDFDSVGMSLKLNAILNGEGGCT